MLPVDNLVLILERSQATGSRCKNVLLIGSEIDSIFEYISDKKLISLLSHPSRNLQSVLEREAVKQAVSGRIEPLLDSDSTRFRHYGILIARSYRLVNQSTGIALYENRMERLRSLLEKVPLKRIVSVLAEVEKNQILTENETGLLYSILSREQLVALLNHPKKEDVSDFFKRKALLDRVSKEIDYLLDISRKNYSKNKRLLNRLYFYLYNYSSYKDEVKEAKNKLNKLFHSFIRDGKYDLIRRLLAAAPTIINHLDLNDVELEAVWFKCPDYFEEAARFEEGRFVFSSIEKLVEIFYKKGNMQQIKEIFGGVVGKFDNDRIKELINTMLFRYGNFVKQTCQREQAFWIGLLDPKRAYNYLIAKYSLREQEEMFPQLSQELRGRIIFLNSGDYQDLVEEFRFKLGWSYKQAQRYYWDLSRKYHTDFGGDDLTLCQRLNSLWSEVENAYKKASNFQHIQ
ncbi:hypothetical protein ACFL52_02475 [Candidatus Margulisiibacteriota bacterium]